MNTERFPCQSMYLYVMHDGIKWYFTPSNDKDGFVLHNYPNIKLNIYYVQAAIEWLKKSAIKNSHVSIELV